MRCAIGGWEAIKLAHAPPRRPMDRPSGSAMHKFAVPRLIDAVGSTAASILASALGSACGLLVSAAPEASARYSRLLDTIIASACPMIGASTTAISQITI